MVIAVSRLAFWVESVRVGVEATLIPSHGFRCWKRGGWGTRRAERRRAGGKGAFSEHAVLRSTWRCCEGRTSRFNFSANLTSPPVSCEGLGPNGVFSFRVGGLCAFRRGSGMWLINNTHAPHTPHTQQRSQRPVSRPEESSLALYQRQSRRSSVESPVRLEGIPRCVCAPAAVTARCRGARRRLCLDRLDPSSVPEVV
ncbi:hypothetical protein GOODEAATRI_000196 [Goodea atripinnis]|uniref:Uncharacterized protein n=1 Tax=Goodea atripinnis TaxID=208336 RepID=A0ABV0P3T3_9TELE